MATLNTPQSVSLQSANVSWKRCDICQNKHFETSKEFSRHLREFHCSREGGSFVCKYGSNGVCPSLPLDGVSDRDYEDHVMKDHMSKNYGIKSTDGTNYSRLMSESVPRGDKPSIVEDQYTWTVFNSKVNLPAALNDPRLARRESDFFTKTWGEGFEKRTIPPAKDLPVITKNDFRKYLRKTSKRVVEHKKHMLPDSQSEASLPMNEFPLLVARKLDKHKLDLEDIPKMFMHPNFSLENVETFSAVFPWTQIELNRQEKTGPKQSSKLLQEKLSHYLDVVEVQIAKQISLRSEAFFHAMTSHDELQANMSATCKTINLLREKVRNIDSLFVRGPLQILRTTVTRSNHVQVYNKLKLMSTVHQTQPTIQLLLSHNEFVGALDLISTTQEVLSQELQGLVCFRHLGSQLSEMEKLVDRMMQDDFAKYANQDLNRPVDEGSSALQEVRGG